MENNEKSKETLVYKEYYLLPTSICELKRKLEKTEKWARGKRARDLRLASAGRAKRPGPRPAAPAAGRPAHCTGGEAARSISRPAAGGRSPGEASASG